MRHAVIPVVGWLLVAAVAAGCESGPEPLANPPSLVIPAVLSAGGDHTCGLTSAGAARCWGSNGHGELGTGDLANSATPAPVAGSPSFAAIAAGGSFTCALTSSRAVYCWGTDGAGNYFPHPVDLSGGLSFTALTAGAGHACALTSGGTAYCWGGNDAGQLGTGSTTNSATPVRVAGGVTFAALAAGQWHTCGLSQSGAAYCWGLNASGELGIGSITNWADSAPAPVAGGLTFTTLAAGGGHTCGLTSSGAAYCWGRNTVGELGTVTVSATYSALPIPAAQGLTFTALTAGGGGGFSIGHTCGLTSDGVVWCWGSNSEGQLGDGSTANSTAPVAVAGGLRFSALSAGENHTCGLTRSGGTYCWGLNRDGELGDGTARSLWVPGPVSSLQPATLLRGGMEHTCALVAGGAAFCWGENWFGQLGNGTSPDSEHFTPVVTSSAARSVFPGMRRSRLPNGRPATLKRSSTRPRWSAN